MEMVVEKGDTVLSFDTVCPSVHLSLYHLPPPGWKDSFSLTPSHKPQDAQG